MEKVPSKFLPEASLFQELEEASKKAAELGRNAYTFIDFFVHLPLWLSPEAIGGKTSVQGDEFDSALQFDGHSSTATVQQLSEALKKATAKPWFFKSL